MRILRLPVDGRRVVDLHPALSVVTALEPAQATRLRRSVCAISSGLAPEGGGLLEAHGLLLDAAQDDLDLLDLGADPRPGVATGATWAHDERAGPAGSADEDPLGRLAALERDVLLLATDRRWAAAALAATRRDAPADERDLVRAEQLRRAIARHDAVDVEPLRRALDADRDAGTPDHDAAVAGVADELAALGVDLRPHPVEPAEVRRTAADLLDEHRRHAAWAVGARVELDGLERRLLAAHDPSPSGRAVLPESAEGRAERAAAAQAAAIARADEWRSALAADPHGPRPSDVVAAALRALAGRVRDHVAGTAPLLLDRVLTGLDDDGVGALLDRLAPVARGVQVVVADDHPAAAAWAASAPTALAALVRPTPAPAAGGSPTMPRTTTPGGPHA